MQNAISHARAPLALAAELAVNVALPYALYVLTQAPLGEVRALLLASAPPVVSSIAGIALRRKVDAIALMSLAGIALSLLAFIGSGDARMLLLREKLVTGLIGGAFLVSVLVGKPLLYLFAQAGMRRRDPAEAERFEARYGAGKLRHHTGLMTVVWGLGLIADVAISAALIFVIPVSSYLVVNPVLGYAVMGALSAWSFWYARRHGLNGKAARAPITG